MVNSGSNLGDNEGVVTLFDHGHELEVLQPDRSDGGLWEDDQKISHITDPLGHYEPPVVESKAKNLPWATWGRRKMARTIGRPEKEGESL